MYMSFISIVIGAALGILFYVAFAGALRKFWVAPPAEPNPDDIKPVDLKYRCGVCGAEVTMTMAPVILSETKDLPDSPRHCREDMMLTTSD